MVVQNKTLSKLGKAFNLQVILAHKLLHFYLVVCLVLCQIARFRVHLLLTAFLGKSLGHSLFLVLLVKLVDLLVGLTVVLDHVVQVELFELLQRANARLFEGLLRKVLKRGE